MIVCAVQNIRSIFRHNINRTLKNISIVLLYNLEKQSLTQMTNKQRTNWTLNNSDVNDVFKELIKYLSFNL